MTPSNWNTDLLTARYEFRHWGSRVFTDKFNLFCCNFNTVFNF